MVMMMIMMIYGDDDDSGDFSRQDITRKAMPLYLTINYYFVMLSH